MLLGVAIFPSTALGGNGWPSFMSVSASRVAHKEAFLAAAIRPEGTETTYKFWIAYEETCDRCRGKLVTTLVGQGTLAATSGEETVSAQATGLTARKYTYFVAATNAHGTSRTVMFTLKKAVHTTGLLPPLVQRAWVTKVARGSAELRASLNSPEGEGEDTFQFWLEAMDRGPELIKSGAFDEGAEGFGESTEVTGLTEDTSYTFWVHVSDSSRAETSSRVTFTTK